jgi:hypothetical protein
MRHRERVVADFPQLSLLATQPHMTSLSRRMIEDMTLRNLTHQTMQCDLARFARHFNTSPEHVGPEHVHAFLLQLLCSPTS